MDGPVTMTTALQGAEAAAAGGAALSAGCFGGNSGHTHTSDTDTEHSLSRRLTPGSNPSVCGITSARDSAHTRYGRGIARCSCACAYRK